MAKSKSILDIKGTFQGVTHVCSHTYGDDIRAARGTHKKVIEKPKKIEFKQPHLTKAKIR